MNDPARPHTARDRDRAVARLRALTTGTAVAGLVATAGFGFLAASNYSGHATTTSTIGNGSVSSVTGGATDDSSGSNTEQSGDESQSGEDPSQSSTSQSNGSTSLQPPTTVTIPAFGGGRVTSGGSH